MIGVSLRFRQLLDGLDDLLETLADKGASSIELRTVGKDTSPQDVLRVCEKVWRHKMRVSVHTESAQGDILLPLQDMFKADRQDDFILVLHPMAGDNVAMMQQYIDVIRKNGYPARLALENNRLMPDKSEGDGAALAADIIKCCDPQYAGTCFDFGHYAWYSKVWEKDITLPPKAFTDRVIHTHIHALYPKDNGYTTHFPLQTGMLPLKEYLACLGKDYSGVLNLELSGERFSQIMPLEQAVLGSMEYLA